MAEMRASTENSKRDSTRRCPGVIGTSSTPIHRRKGRVLIHDAARRLLDQRNALKALHGAGKRGGFHAFRRFRFAVLRKAGVPDNLIKRWLGHSQNLMNHTRCNYSTTCPIGRNSATGLAWESSWANWATKAWSQFARHSSRKPVQRQVLGLVAGARYVPNRQFLSISFRSELTHRS
jgi:hypothetical protein